jgi:hypothetical protein
VAEPLDLKYDFHTATGYCFFFCLKHVVVIPVTMDSGVLVNY